MSRPVYLSCTEKESLIKTSSRPTSCRLMAAAACEDIEQPDVKRFLQLIQAFEFEALVFPRVYRPAEPQRNPDDVARSRMCFTMVASTSGPI